MLWKYIRKSDLYDRGGRHSHHYRLFCGCLGELELPAEIGGKSVTRIGDSAFRATPPLQAFRAGQRRSISDSAFAGCTALTHIDLPQTMTSFGREVFNTCTSLEDHHSRASHLCRWRIPKWQTAGTVSAFCTSLKSAAAIYLENH
ncbi:MAG: leucine-rich repeat protein [Ruminococcus callidus]